MGFPLLPSDTALMVRGAWTPKDLAALACQADLTG
jgi:hypothetical protein